MSKAGKTIFKVAKTRLQMLGIALIVGLTVSAYVQIAQAQNADNARILNHPEVKSLPGNDKRWALIIGVNNYGLKGAVNDARALRNTLVKYAGFAPEHVVLLTTDDPEKLPSRNRILSELDVLSRAVPPDGFFLFSFSGHGETVGNDAYLVPSDGQVTVNSRLFRDFSIDVARIHDAIEEMKVKQVMLVLDSCRDRIDGRGGQPEPLTAAMGRAFDLGGSNKTIEAFVTIYAARVGESAYEYFDEDTQQWRGYFSKAIEEGLRGKAADEKGQVTLGRLLDYLDEVVPSRSFHIRGVRQVPWKNIAGYRESELVLVSATDLKQTSSKTTNDGVRTNDESWMDNVIMMCRNPPAVAKLNPFPVGFTNPAKPCTNFPAVDARVVDDGRYSSSAEDYSAGRSVRSGDLIRIRIYIDNGAGNNISAKKGVAKNVKLNISVDQSIGPEHLIRVSFAGDNTNTIQQSFPIRTASNEFLEVVPKTGQLRDWQNKLIREHFDLGNNTFPIGDLTPGFETDLFLYFDVTVKSAEKKTPALASQTTSPSAPTITKARKVLLFGPDLILFSDDEDKGKEAELSKEFLAPLAEALDEQGLVVKDLFDLTERDRSQIEGDLVGPPE